MGKFRFKFHPESRFDIMQSERTQEMVEDVTRRVQSRAGNGYGMKTGLVGDRASGIVYTDTFKARHDNARNNTLLKALGGLDAD